MCRFGTGIRKEFKKDPVPGPGTHEAPEYIKIKSHNAWADDKNKTMFQTKQQNLDPAYLKNEREKVSTNKMKFKGDSLGPG